MKKAIWLLVGWVSALGARGAIITCSNCHRPRITPKKFDNVPKMKLCVYCQARMINGDEEPFELSDWQHKTNDEALVEYHETKRRQVESKIKNAA